MKNRLINKVRNIREAHFYRQGSEVSAAEIFKEIYAPLAPLVVQNKKILSKVKNSLYNSLDIEEQRVEVLEKQARGEMESKNYGIMAKVSLHTGETINYTVKPRTNFTASLLKFPNVLYLYSDESSPMILRESVDRGESPSFNLRAKQYFGKRYAGPVNLEDKTSLGRTDVVSIAEPNLMLALEHIYFGQVAPRITPSFKIVDFSDKHMWYLREFLPSFRDSSCPNTSLFDYNGVLNGLGLMDSIDTQFAHYCVDNNQVVNIDPDFITYTKSQDLINQVDFGEFKKIIADEKIDNKFINPDLNQRRFSLINQTQANLRGNSFLDYLHSDISKSPMFDSLRTENSGSIKDKL